MNRNENLTYKTTWKLSRFSFMNSKKVFSLFWFRKGMIVWVGSAFFVVVSFLMESNYRLDLQFHYSVTNLVFFVLFWRTVIKRESSFPMRWLCGFSGREGSSEALLYRLAKRNKNGLHQLIPISPATLTLWIRAERYMTHLKANVLIWLCKLSPLTKCPIWLLTLWQRKLRTLESRWSNNHHLCQPWYSLSH